MARLPHKGRTVSRNLTAAGATVAAAFHCLQQTSAPIMIRQPVAADKYYSRALPALQAELQRCLDAPAPNLAGGPCLHCLPGQRRHLRGLIVSSTSHVQGL